MSWIDKPEIALVLVTTALAAVTVLLVIATLWMAAGTRKLAAIAEKDFRAARLPVAQLSWTDFGKLWLDHASGGDEDEGLFGLIVCGQVSVATDQDMILQRLEAWVTPTRAVPSERPRRVCDEEPMHRLEVGGSYDVVFNVDFDGPPDPANAHQRLYAVRVEAEVGNPAVGDSERWVSFSDIYQDAARSGSYHIRSRGPLRRQRKESYREKLKRTLERWDECQERWKREMNP